MTLPALAIQQSLDKIRSELLLIAGDSVFADCSTEIDDEFFYKPLSPQYSQDAFSEVLFNNETPQKFDTSVVTNTHVQQSNIKKPGAQTVRKGWETT